MTVKRLFAATAGDHRRPGLRLAAAVGRDVKGKVSAVLYLLGIAAAFLDYGLSQAVYVLVACIWLVPDRPISQRLR